MCRVGRGAHLYSIFHTAGVPGSVDGAGKKARRRQFPSGHVRSGRSQMPRHQQKDKFNNISPFYGMAPATVSGNRFGGRLGA